MAENQLLLLKVIILNYIQEITQNSGFYRGVGYQEKALKKSENVIR